MPRRPSRKTLRNKADRLFSLYIRGRDAVCQRCGAGSNLQCAHVFSRRYHNVRWDTRNAIALCAGCHKTFTHNPIAWEDFMTTRMGEEAYRQLRADAQVIGQKVNLDAVIAFLTEEQSA